jgi:predicted HNH restriction endonuclease
VVLSQEVQQIRVAKEAQILSRRWRKSLQSMMINIIDLIIAFKSVLFQVLYQTSHQPMILRYYLPSHHQKGLVYDGCLHFKRLIQERLNEVPI